MNCRKIILDKEELYKKYILEGLSQKKTADYFKCSVDTVVKNLKEYGIKSHKTGYWKQSNTIQINNHQKDILYGALLGDGCLIKHKNGVNAQFSYTSKSKQHVEFVCNDFMEYSYKEGVKKIDVYDKRTDKIYTRYTFRTITDKGLLSEYNKWYKDGKKHIPKDLVLNPLICLIWYIGDGGLLDSKRSQYIKLSTQCFDKIEQENILIQQLSQFNAKLTKADKSKYDDQQYFIYIPHKNVKMFLDYIGECPFDDYRYKWNLKEYKNKQPMNHKEKELLFCEMYKNGMTYYAIAKEFGIEPNAVKYYLKKNNLY